MTDTRDSVISELQALCNLRGHTLPITEYRAVKEAIEMLTALQAGAGDADRLNWLANGGWEVMQDPDMWPPNLNFRETIDHGRVVVSLDAIGNAQATEGK